MICKDSEPWETQIRKLGSVRRAVMDIRNGLPVQVTWEDSDLWTGLLVTQVHLMIMLQAIKKHNYNLIHKCPIIVYR